jgi:hypothetical protein
MPLTGQLCVVWTLQVPATLVQVASVVQDWPAGLLQVPGVVEQAPAPLQDWPAGVTQVPRVFVHAGPGLQARPLVLHVPGVCEQFAAMVQLWPDGVTQVPFWDGQSVFSVQAAPPTVQWPLFGVPVHCPAEVQDWPAGVTHTPGVAVHWAAVVQDWPAGLLHVPGVWLQTVFCVAAVHCVPEGVTQVPAATQGLVVPLQAAPVRLQVPPWIAQSLPFACVHDSPSLLHLPICAQAPADMQGLASTLHTPGWFGHSPGSMPWIVQLPPVMLQVPGLGVHTGGAHCCVELQGFSGSGGSRLQPGGVYTVVHTGGWQVCVPGRVQVCVSGPLHVWDVKLQDWGVPLQVCGPVLHVGGWTLLHAAGTKPLHWAPATPTHCCGM